MSITATIFHTATVEHRVPGPAAGLVALAYNLQYTKPLVQELLDGNPPAETEFQLLRLADRELVRANMYGSDPRQASRRVCAIGLGDNEDDASAAARDAWFDYHASVMFSELLDAEGSHLLAIAHRVPGVPVQRARTVGVAYRLRHMSERVDAAVARNMPTTDEVAVVQAGELTLMRVDLHGRHPLDATRSVCVAGIADRHYRAMAAAEEAWRNYHTSLLFSARALGSL